MDQIQILFARGPFVIAYDPAYAALLPQDTLPGFPEGQHKGWTLREILEGLIHLTGTDKDLMHSSLEFESARVRFYDLLKEKRIDEAEKALREELMPYMNPNAAYLRTMISRIIDAREDDIF